LCALKSDLSRSVWKLAVIDKSYDWGFINIAPSSFANGRSIGETVVRQNEHEFLCTAFLFRPYSELEHAAGLRPGVCGLLSVV
jgi:hypothetical protein